jgi:RNA polymerase sigma factor (sigma-70 family)
MARYLSRLKHWASGRVPDHIRSVLDTDDLVQDALLGTIRQIDRFIPKHDGALMAYLREAVWNRLRMELRKKRTNAEVASDDLDLHACGGPSPLDRLVGKSRIAQYERALASLDDDDRAAIVGRFEMCQSYAALARALDRPSPDAARKAVERAVRRLSTAMSGRER